MIKKWTLLEVSDQFEDAVYTLKRLPPVRVKGYFNSWPTVVRSIAERLQEDKLPFKLGSPSASSISKLEECLEWILWLDDENERLAVWMRANKVNWKLICRRIGCGRTKAWQTYTCALLKIVTRLNAREMAGLNVRTTKH